MEIPKQGQPPRVAGSAATARPPLPGAITHPTQVEYPAVFYNGNWGAQVPVSSYLIVPMSQLPAQVGVPRPNATSLSVSGARPLSRVSLRPPQQVLSVQTALPGMAAMMPSPSMIAGKKMAASPKVQMLKSVPSRSSGSKRPAQELLPKAQPQLFESVRSKFRETLAAALNMDSDQQCAPQSAGTVSHVGSASVNKQVDGAAIDSVTKTSALISGQDNMLSSNSASNMAVTVSDDMQQQSIHVPLENKVLDNNSCTLDELLQGHGLCWSSDIVVGASETISQSNPERVRKSDIDDGVDVSLIEHESKRIKTDDGAAEEKKSITQKAQILAFEIEGELFTLLGGVNKKYKEKGRSLLFNLKDKSNPVLRERVLSGDITPKRLCSMTTEELASKELSDWRLAKAEELAKMVVLPSKEVDVRRLVRKTHKGEFQVEVEETDGISVEVGIGGDLLSHVPSRPTEGQTKTDDKSVHTEETESDNSEQDGVVMTSSNNMPSDLEHTANEKTDLMQDLMVDDLKDRENLPPIMSLDEFMETLDSEPPFKEDSTQTVKDDPSSIEETDISLKSEDSSKNVDRSSASDSQLDPQTLSPQDKCESKLQSPKKEAGSILFPVEQLKEDLLVKSSPEKANAENTDTGSQLIPESITDCKSAPDALLTHDSVWEGTIQLSLSSLTNVVAIFKSGEKTSTNEWRHFVDIKGRVRLSAFQEFLEQLPKSRSRAIMVTELRWKAGSLESGRQHLLQTIDSYISDERVGLVKPADGVELYLCPSQGKAAQILAEHLPKEHSSSLTVTGTSAIGVVVWRRPHVSPRIPVRNDGSRKQSISRKQQAVIASAVPLSSKPTNERQHHRQDVVTDDVPPGFGPGVVREDDDLPEYDFVTVPNAAANVVPSQQAYRNQQQHSQAASRRPVDHVREMVRKYGSRSAATAQPWEVDDDDDDIPEWDPNQSNLNLQQTRHAIPQPPLPPPGPVHQQMHTYHQQQQQHHYQSIQQYHATPESQNTLPQAYYVQSHSQQHSVPVQQLTHVQPGWQTTAQWLAAGAAVATHSGLPANNVVQQYCSSATSDSSGQGYATGNQGSTPWNLQVTVHETRRVAPTVGDSAGPHRSRELG
uniref:TFIIS central domain-containing protein n=1 Tax=Oryza punctata TaxID=4537 RepID=A0A0E0LD60_ORYPU